MHAQATSVQEAWQLLIQICAMTAECMTADIQQKLRQLLEVFAQPIWRPLAVQGCCANSKFAGSGKGSVHPHTMSAWIVHTILLLCTFAAVNPAEACHQVHHHQISSATATTVVEAPEPEVTTLYHQTSYENFEAIMASGQMQPGIDSTHSYAGPGIYFAITPEATHHKAHHKGVILECEVLLGAVKRIETPGNWALSEAERAAHGYDSIQIDGLTDMEYVVYDPDRIISIQVFSIGIKKPVFAVPATAQVPAAVPVHALGESAEPIVFPEQVPEPVNVEVRRSHQDDSIKNIMLAVAFILFILLLFSA